MPNRPAPPAPDAATRHNEIRGQVLAAQRQKAYSESEFASGDQALNTLS